MVYANDVFMFGVYGGVAVAVIGIVLLALDYSIHIGSSINMLGWIALIAGFLFAVLSLILTFYKN